MADPSLDSLSPLAHEIIRAGSYGSLVVSNSPPAEARALLSDVMPRQLLSVAPTSPAHAYELVAGLWLWHDALDECHQVAQMGPAELERAASKHGLAPASPGRRADPAELTSTQAFWHAIMHRREGDFWNSKYWYARCRNHPALANIAARAVEALSGRADDRLVARLTRNGWSPDEFVGFVQAADEKRSGPEYELAVGLQRLEWRALFDYCAVAAVTP